MKFLLGIPSHPSNHNQSHLGQITPSNSTTKKTILTHHTEKKKWTLHSPNNKPAPHFGTLMSTWSFPASINNPLTSPHSSPVPNNISIPSRFLTHKKRLNSPSLWLRNSTAKPLNKWLSMVTHHWAILKYVFIPIVIAFEVIWRGGDKISGWLRSPTVYPSNSRFGLEILIFPPLQKTTPLELRMMIGKTCTELMNRSKLSMLHSSLDCGVVLARALPVWIPMIVQLITHCDRLVL